MSIVRLVRHQLFRPPHRKLRRKSVFASRGFRMHSEASKGRLSSARKTAICYDVRHARRRVPKQEGIAEEEHGRQAHETRGARRGSFRVVGEPVDG
jgi:hypothetical protein